MKMTTSWTDYLLCQLSSGQKLSTLECLPSEILDPILGELHCHSVSGVFCFARASRTCRALASPYFFRPLRVQFERSCMDEGYISHQWLSPTAVLLSYSNDYKTLKIHSPSKYRELQQYPNLQYVLKAESPFECLEMLYNLDHCGINMSSTLEAFNHCCPQLSRLVINLGHFAGYSRGWDRELREAIATRRQLPVSQTDVPPFKGNVNICRLAEFSNLKELTIHFELDVTQITLLHPSQGGQALREMFQEIEKRKQGVRLDRLEVVWRTWLGNIYGGMYGCFNDQEIEVKMTCGTIKDGQRNATNDYVLTCDDGRYRKIIERRRTAEKLYGPEAWNYHLGWLTIRRSQGRTALMLRARWIDLMTRIALLPGMSKTNELKRAGRQGIFCA